MYAIRSYYADDDHAGGPDIEAGSVGDCFSDAERDRDHVGEKRRPQPERDRDRHLLDHQLDHRLVVEEALAEIEAQIVADHDEEALGRGDLLLVAGRVADVGRDHSAQRGRGRKRLV